jgi:hypothetical protein
MILGLSFFLLIVILGIVLPNESGYALFSVSLLSLFCFLGFFSVGWLGDVFAVVFNPYVSEVKQMEWSGPFNPMYFAWLFARNKRKWCLYTTVWSAPFGLLFGVILSGLSMASLKTDNLGFALSSLAGAGFIAVESFCWYNGVCKALTEQVEDEKPREVPGEREEMLKND